MEGYDDFIDPRGIVTLDPNNRDGGSPIDETNRCRIGNQSKDGDFFNSPEALMDNLNSHLSSEAQATYYMRDSTT